MADVQGGQLVTNCGLCWSPKLKLILDMGLQPLSERHDAELWFPLMLVRCETCTLVQAGFIVDPEIVFPSDHPYATGNSRALVAHFRKLARELSLDLNPGDLVVDIGANDGTLLAQYTANVRRVGVEPTGQAERARKRDGGLIIYEQFFDTALAGHIAAKHGLAKVVTATNVLAHVPEVHGFLSGVWRMLADDGVFVTENHDLSSVVDGLQFDTVYHEHLRYYSIGTLCRLLAMHGLQVYHVEPVPTHGGSFRAWACKERNGLQERADDAAAKLRDLLLWANRDECKVYGIGATTRATPLIHFAGIEAYVECVCEVASSDKLGRMMPGTKIPVVDEAKLYEDQPQYALLFSWHMADELMSTLRRNGYRGDFIIPLPEPRIEVA